MDTTFNADWSIIEQDEFKLYENCNDILSSRS